MFVRVGKHYTLNKLVGAGLTSSAFMERIMESLPTFHPADLLRCSESFNSQVGCT